MQSIMNRTENNNSRPGSRMARALHASERVEQEEEASSSGGVQTRARMAAHNIGSSSQSSNNANSEAVPPVHCEHCGRPFRNLRGLGVHVVRAHPVEANAGINVERDKARWPLEEVSLMARAEANATLAGGVRFMNQHLHALFPQRTLEAIKGKRRQEAYRAMVQEFCLQASAQNVEDADEGPEEVDAMIERVASPPTAIADNNDPSVPCLPQAEIEALREALSALSVPLLRLRSYQAERLNSLVRQALDEGINVTSSIERWLEDIFPRQAVQPPGPRKRRGKRPPKDRKENREQKRRREYAEVQTLYKKNMRACLNNILQRNTAGERPPSVAFRDYWTPLIERTSDADGDMEDLRRNLRVVRQKKGASGPFGGGSNPEGVGAGAGEVNTTSFPDKSSLWSPITTSEVIRASLRAGSAPGLDGITPRSWNKVPPVVRAVLYNLLLLAREVPASISMTRTTFLEKGDMPVRPQPADYRPLSIGSVVLRQFHKILATRLGALNIFDERQRGFRPVDGVFENITILSAVLKEAKRRRKTLHLASVDLSKAFDTVSHEAIHKALEELDLPSSFRGYIRAAYNNAHTTLQLPGLDGTAVRLGRGVKQGDPLSPLLFNLVVDRALGVLSEDVGFKLGDELVNALAYADDIVLLSSTTVGLQENLNRLHAAFSKCGLSVNAKKTGVLSLVASGRDKKVKVVTTPSFTLGDSVLPQRSPVEVWRYLGMQYEGAREAVHTSPMAEALQKITKAPLKPQQKLKLLSKILLPSQYHLMVVGDLRAKPLKALDVLVRKTVRTWLRLPHDVPAGYFHAPIQSGGLGLPLLKTFIPILKHKRLQRICRSSLPVARAAATTPYVARQLVRCEDLMKVAGMRVSSTAELRGQCERRLYESCDGNGLREAGNSRLNSHWVDVGASSIPGADYVHYHHVRIACLPSRARLSRGRTGRDVRCRGGCLEVETPSHCVQRCFRTHGGRILRHNDLCRQVAGFLRQKGWQVDEELSYPTAAGNLRPDLTIVKDGVAVVVDAQVVSSETALNVSHRRKVEKYSTSNDLVDRVAEHTGVPRNNVAFTAITISWRGIWSPDSDRELQGLGLTPSQLRQLTTRVLWGSWLNWRRFNSITSRFHRRDS